MSIANLKVSAKLENKEIYKYLKNKTDPIFSMPFPLMNIINGGAHANNSLEIQEFMIRPDGANSFKNVCECVLSNSRLKKKLEDKNISTSVGDEGGLPHL